MRRMPARLRERRDWVYSEESYGSTYTLTAGPDNAQAIPLVYSQNARRVIVYGQPLIEPTWANRLQVQSGAASPELSKQKIFAVTGWCRITPVNFQAGTGFHLGLRLMHADMAPESAIAALLNGYTMMPFVAGDARTAAQYANEGYLKEWRVAEAATAVNNIVQKGQWMYRIGWRSQRGVTLGNGRGLYMYMESSSGSLNINVQYWLRTSMRAPLG